MQPCAMTPICALTPIPLRKLTSIIWILMFVRTLFCDKHDASDAEQTDSDFAGTTPVCYPWPSSSMWVGVRGPLFMLDY